MAARMIVFSCFGMLGGCFATPRPTASSATDPALPTGAKFVNYVIGDLPSVELGGTHLILSFIEPSTPGIPKDGDNAWIKYALQNLTNLTSIERTTYLKRFRAGGTKVLASVGGELALHSVYKRYNASLFGARAAKYAADLGLDGLDIDLEGWGNDREGGAFLKAMTKGAFDYFAQLNDSKRYVLTHAPEMPDFWNGLLYMELMADRKYFDMIDFLNMQFYNQIPFPSHDYIFIKDVYDPRSNAPTSIATIAQGISNASAGAISVAEAQSKILLGFPCKDGSFPVGGANLNMCNDPQFDLVKYGVKSLDFNLAGVFEWSASVLTDVELLNWNTNMQKAIGNRNGKASNILQIFQV